MIRKQILNYIRDLPLMSHAVAFYESDSDANSILLNNLKYGFENGEAGILVAAQPVDRVRKIAERSGMDPRRLEKDGQLRVTTCRDWYLKQGKGSKETIIRNWVTLMKEAESAGFNGLRFSTELTCFLAEGKIKEMLDYESSIGSEIELPFKVRGICAHDSRQVTRIDDGRCFLRLLKAHGHVIFPGIAFKLDFIGGQTP